MSTSVKYPQLPKRPYYSLQQAADELGTDTDHLIALGALGLTEIVARPAGGFWFRVDARYAKGEPSDCVYERELGLVQCGTFSWVLLHPAVVNQIECNGCANIGGWSKAADVLLLSPVNETARSHRIWAESIFPDASSYPVFIIPIPEDIDGIEVPDFSEMDEIDRPLMVDRSRLYLLGSEVERLKEGGAARSYPAVDQKKQQQELQRLRELPVGRRRNSALSLILGMAMNEYGYQPFEKKSPIPKELEAVVSKFGMKITSATIRSLLDEARDTLLPLNASSEPPPT